MAYSQGGGQRKGSVWAGRARRRRRGKGGCGCREEGLVEFKACARLEVMVGCVICEGILQSIPESNPPGLTFTS